MQLALVLPDATLRDSYLKALADFQAEGLPWMLDLDAVWIAQHFPEYVERLLQKQFIRTEQLVPETVFWALVDGKFAGRISVRHELNEALKVMGGHIGYETAPQFRGQGVANEMLRQALPRAQRLGLERVLLTCNDDNHASIRVIEKNGGVLEKKATIPPNNQLKRYYWIRLY